MNNNDIFRRLRYAFDINDTGIVHLYKLANYSFNLEHLAGFLGKESDPEFTPMSDELLEYFLDGYIVMKRGPKKEGTAPDNPPLSNNQILRKIKIALKLRDEDISAIMLKAYFKVSKSELTALFRNPKHPKYKPCGNQFLRNFLNGLTLHMRPDIPPSED